MPIYNGSRKIKNLYIGGRKIGKLYKGGTLVYSSKLKLPTSEKLPTTYTTTQVASVSGVSWTTYTVPENGFYQVEVRGAGGGNSGESGQPGGVGGYISRIVYLYKGTKCLIWGAGAGTKWSYTTYGISGYPGTSSSLGGRGATGHSEGGGGGGSAHGDGAPASHADGSSGGGGAGFLAGTDEDITYMTHRESGWSAAVESTTSWKVQGIKNKKIVTRFSIAHVYCYVLAGGGGGSCGKNDDARASGGGGGAYGNGGNTPIGVVAATTGPGGTWGKGADGVRYGQGGAGAWAILDFSRNQWQAGVGGGASEVDGYCILRRIVRTA